MQIIENLKIKEKLYVEKLENGLTILILPKQNTKKKAILFGTNFGSIDNHFIDPKTDKEVIIPDGVAHFLEHKLFEQSNGTNSLDTLSALGVEPNAYTTTDHTAYYFECTNNFYEALDELLDYTQNPYFTDENVEKEQGIIGQEIDMYEDSPEFKVYVNALDCLYEKNTVKIDALGTKETIAQITKEILYNTYNIFYNPSNMVISICGDFIPEEMIEEIKKRLKDRPHQGEIKRIYKEEPSKIHKKELEVQMDVSNPLFVIGIKDNLIQKEEMVKRHLAVEIILTMIFGHSSNLYKKLYDSGYLLSRPSLEYEIAKQYCHVLISGMSKDPKYIYTEFIKKVNEFKKDGLEEETFERMKKKVYGNYVMEYNSVGSIARMLIFDFFRNINSFDYLEEYNGITIEYVNQVLKEVFKEENMILSIVKGKNEN